MAGCLDSVTVTIPKMPRMDGLLEFLSERRNKVTAITAGVLVSKKRLNLKTRVFFVEVPFFNPLTQFFSGWWFAIDAAAVYPNKSDLKDVFHICGVFATISMFMINSVSNGQASNKFYLTTNPKSYLLTLYVVNGCELYPQVLRLMLTFACN